jgi:hypothetical protein
MITLVTQYNVLKNRRTKGWDGADRPYVFHSIVDGRSKTLAPHNDGMSTEIEDWTEDANWLTNFRLELTYG